MDTIIFYYSGTGNSLFIAKSLARKLNGQYINIARYLNNSQQEPINADTVGIVFPCYAYTYPKILNRFIKKIKSLLNFKYMFLIVTYGSTFAKATDQLAKKLEKNGLKTHYTAGILMPENYIAVFKPDLKDVIEQKISNAKIKTEQIANDIKNKIQYSKRHTNVLDYIKTFVIGTIFNVFLNFAHIFFKTKKTCTACGICTKVCLSNNIIIKKGKPKFGNRCTQCMACLNWCPNKCIDYTFLTKKRARYTNPEVELKELL